MKELIEIQVDDIGRSGWYKDGQLILTTDIGESDEWLTHLLEALGIKRTIAVMQEIENEEGKLGRFPLKLPDAVKEVLDNE